MSFEAELVTRYGRDVLNVPRKDVPPRVATPTKHGVTRMLAVVPRAGARRKLVDEIRQEGHKAHVARHRVDKDVPANLVFTNALPAFAKHAREVLAEIPVKDILRLYGVRPPKPEADTALAFVEGDIVQIQRGPFAAFNGIVIEPCKRGYIVDVSIFGRLCRVSIAQESMRKIHIEPG